MKPPQAALRPRELEAFTEALSHLLDSDLGLARALSVIEASGSGKAVRALAARLRSRLSHGQGMAAALGAEGKAVPSLYADIVATGEAASDLAPSFSRLSAWLGASRRFKDELASALVYPAIVLATLLAAIALVRSIVLPRMENFVSALGPAAGAALAASMRRADAACALMSIGLCILVAAFALLAALRRRPGTAAPVERFILRLPLIGPSSARRARSELAFAMESLCASGMPIGSALARCAERTGNAALAADLGRAVQALRRGEGLAASCSRSPFFDAEALQWLSLADAGGRSLQAFSAMRASAEAALARARALTARLLDPALSLVAGAFVALFVALFVLPLFEAMGSFFQ